MDFINDKKHLDILILLAPLNVLFLAICVVNEKRNCDMLACFGFVINLM